MIVFTNGLLNGLVVVLIGDYIAFRQYKIKAGLNWLFFFLSAFLTFVLAAVMIALSNVIPAFAELEGHFIANSSPLVILASIALVQIFLCLKFSSRLINYLASTIFCYLSSTQQYCFQPICVGQILCSLRAY